MVGMFAFVLKMVRPKCSLLRYTDSRSRREPDPCVRRRGGAGTHPAPGRMGPAGFGNAGLSP